MSNSDIRVVPGPANYFSHPGSLERLSDFLTPTSSRERCGSMASALWPAPNLFCRRPSTCRRRKDPLYRPLQRTRRGGAGAGLR